jgi:hypothetical protein
MEKIIRELRDIVTLFSGKLNQFSEEELSIKKAQQTWSKKEVMGHLIDAAQINLRRFICGQYENESTRIVYDQDFWVSANNYNEMMRDE